MIKARIVKKEPIYQKASALTDVFLYGESNNYPQESRRLIDKSPTAGAVVDVYGDFIKGRGFGAFEIGDEGRLESVDIDQDLEDTIINFHGDTIGDLREAAADDWKYSGGCAFIVNWDANYQVSSVFSLPLEFCRFEKIDSYHKANRVLVCRDWEAVTGFSTYKDSAFVERYHLFSSDPEVIKAQVQESGGWNKYKGQVLYFAYRGDIYPKPIYHAVRKYMATEYLLGEYKYNSVDGGFVGNKILTIKGKFEDDEAVDKLEADVNQLRGAEGVRKYLILEGLNSDGDERTIEVTDLDPSVNDKLFKFTEISAEDKIVRAFKGPDPILVGINRQTSGISNNSGESYVKAQQIYNGRTEAERTKLSGLFKKIFEFYPGIESDFKIVPIQLQA